jgi:hypothetical protein
LHDLKRLVFLILAFCSVVPALAVALPVFAHRYGYSCSVCHTAVPHLNPFGEAFRENGFRLSRLPDYRAFPIAAKFNLAYSGTTDPSGLPKATLDELELLTGGSAGKNVGYFVEQYVVDGGRPGKTRDAWLSVKNAISVRAGQFTLPLPVDVEDERDTLAHYAAFDQIVGSNPFSMFEPRIGLDASVGGENGTALHVAALLGHDPQAGLPTYGIDRMTYAQLPAFGFTWSAYRYDGTRPLGPLDDRFWRQGLAFRREAGKLRFDLLAQSGWDSSADGTGRGDASSAGFAQLHWEFSPAFAAVARYDATSDDRLGAQRSMTASLIGRPARNMRLTVEGHFSGGSTTASTALLFAY